MKYREEIRDLFEVNNELFGSQPYCLAHCISADFGMFGGIVVGFNERWNMKDILKSSYVNVQKDFRVSEGLVIPVEVIDHGISTLVYNLITKETVNSLPTYENIVKTLEILKSIMISNGNTKLAIPKIGCGIDKLEWEVVRILITETFADTNIEILVCIKE